MPELSELCRANGRVLEFALVGLGQRLTESVQVSPFQITNPN